MIEEGKSFNETMKDIWKDWVAMAIQEVQRLIAKLITAWIIKQLINATTGGAGGGLDALGVIAGGKSFNTGNGGLMPTPNGSEIPLLVQEIRQLRQQMHNDITTPVQMNWRRGEMHRAVAEDGLHRRVI